jgi:AcrR family transcriptional regulator
VKTTSSRRRVPRRSAAAAPVVLPLGRERIVDTALALVRDLGLGAFSTRRLGERLGCEAMSLYHHFPSKQHLLDAMVDRVLGSIEFPDPALDPADRVRAIARAYRDMARRHPAFYPLLTVHRLNTPLGVATIDRILEIIGALVPDAELAARHFRTLGYYLTGAALDETSGYARGPSAAEPASDADVAAHCPHLAAAAPFFAERHWEATFSLGLDALMARMEVDGRALRKAAAARR